VLPASGAQWELHQGRQRLIVVQVGATLREFDVGGQAVLDGFPMDRMADGARGQPLLPWPNRLADGRYEFEGQKLQLPIDEVERQNAIHGLTRWLNWTLASHTSNAIRLEHLLHPRPGYPFTLALAIEYQLDDNGLTVRTHAHNRGQRPLPFGAGQHPYFTLGTPFVDDLILEIPTSKRIELHPRQRVPTGRIIEGEETDFRTPRPIGATILDECYCDPRRDSDGRIRVRLANPETGRTMTVWADNHYKYLQVFTGETLAPERRRRGLAVEPMTCPPNAFRTQTDVVVLQPERQLQLEWGVQVEN